MVRRWSLHPNRVCAVTAAALLTDQDGAEDISRDTSTSVPYHLLTSCS